MILSMTGFGKATRQVCEGSSVQNVTVEIKTLNAKSIEIYTKIPDCLRIYDIEIRKIIAGKVLRGRVDVSITIDSPTDNNISSSDNPPINKEIFLYYFNQLKKILTDLSLSPYPNIVSDVLRMPNIFSQTPCSSDHLWKVVQQLLIQSTELLYEFRLQEGLAMQNMLVTKLSDIENLLNAISKFESQRISTIKNHLYKRLEEIKNDTHLDIDESKLETELFFYIEKLDITEEKTRLSNHINYFRTTLSEPPPIGKRLSFIAQEMGREINTIGSKANNTDMQVIVVQMKDLLEQIKEQVLNVL